MLAKNGQIPPNIGHQGKNSLTIIAVNSVWITHLVADKAISCRFCLWTKGNSVSWG